MNWEAAHLANRKELWRVVQNGQQRQGQGEGISPPFSGAQKGSVKWISSLLQTRKFQIEQSTIMSLREKLG